MKARRLVGILGLAGIAMACSTQHEGQTVGTEQLALVACGSSENEIRGCADRDSFRILKGTTSTCRRGETLLCWNQVGPAGSDALVTTSPASPSTCPNGGVTLQTGTDANSDGVLEATEVRGVAYVCNGAPGEAGQPGAPGQPGASGATSRVSVTPEPAGAHCAQGGQRIDAGVDTNDNGVLDPNEVASTSYVCNGAGGATGATCTEGQKACAGQTPETCIGGQWVFAATTCANATPICVNGACAECSPNEVRCGVDDSETHPAVLTCTATGHWQVSQVCSGGYPSCGEIQPHVEATCICLAPNITCGDQCLDPFGDINNCGACGHVCATPLTIASGPSYPNAIALGAGNVYWTGVNSGSTLMSAPTTGGTPTMLASGSFFSAIAVDAERVYYLDQNAQSVMSVPVGGGPPIVLAQGMGGFPTAIALDGANVYFTAYYGGNDGVVMSVPVGGGNPTVLASGQHYPQNLVINATTAFWSDYTDGTIRSVPLAGGTVAMMAVGGSPQALAVDATSIYWGDSQSWTVKSAPLSGGAPTLLASDQYALDIAVDGTSVYWTDYRHSTIMKAPIAGGAPTTLAIRQLGRRLAVDATSIYWTSDDGRVSSTPK